MKLFLIMTGSRYTMTFQEIIVSFELDDETVDQLMQLEIGRQIQIDGVKIVRVR